MRGILWVSDSGPPCMWEQPRACGEYVYSIRDDTDVEGTTPRTRGVHQLRRRAPIRGGINPACAGNSYTRIMTAETE